MHALGEDGVALGVGDEGRAGEEDVLEGFGGPSAERNGGRKGVGHVEGCERSCISLRASVKEGETITH